MPKNWPLFFNEFWRDYLSTAESQAAGVPATADVRLLIEQDRATPLRPYLIISHERRPETLRNVYDAKMIITLHTLEDPTSGTTPEAAEDILTAIRNRVSDIPAVQAYIATLPRALATDAGRQWQPAVLHTIAQPWEAKLEEKEGHMARSFDFTFTCIVEEP